MANTATSLIFATLTAAAVGVVVFYSGEVRQEKAALHLAPPPGITKVTLGYGDTISDLLWLRVIQDFDYCDKPRSESVARNPQMTSRCHLDWVYNMLSAITDLAPKFRMAHATGATVLSIAVDDREGARRLFEKAVERFPDDWSILYRAGYHYMAEVGDQARAAELFNRSAKNGAPEWVYNLSAKLFTEAGRADIAVTILEDFLKSAPPSKITEKAQLRLAEAQKILAERSPAKDK